MIITFGAGLQYIYIKCNFKITLFKLIDSHYIYGITNEMIDNFFWAKISKTAITNIVNKAPDTKISLCVTKKTGGRKTSHINTNFTYLIQPRGELWTLAICSLLNYHLWDYINSEIRWNFYLNVKNIRGASTFVTMRR